MDILEKLEAALEQKLRRDRTEEERAQEAVARAKIRNAERHLFEREEDTERTITLRTEER